MRDKQFIINSIKMDLHRVITASGNISNELPKQSVIEFMEHAKKDFEKISLTDTEKEHKQNLQHLLNQVDSIKDPHSRLRWTEDVMTLRCRL